MRGLLPVVAALLVAGGVQALTFVSIGDWGGAGIDAEHKQNQLAVGAAMAKTASAHKAAFVVNVGDNFYYYGVQNLSDPLFDIDFEKAYNQASLMVPWYSALGNHDYGYNVSAQLEYKSPNKNRWVMPARYYTQRIALGSGGAHMTLVVLDTNPCVSAYRANDPAGWDPCGSGFPFPPDCKFHENILSQDCGAQQTWLEGALAAVPAGDWLVVVGHHPIYEVDVFDLTGLIQKYKADLYLNGHTHAMGFYQMDGKGAYVLTGGGAMVDVADSAEPFSGETRTADGATHTTTSVWFETVAAYTAHTFDSTYKTLNTTYYDATGNELYTFTVTRGVPPGPAPPPPPLPGSCAKYGCVAYDKTHTCQCDSECAKYGECCSDYKKVCG